MVLVDRSSQLQRKRFIVAITPIVGAILFPIVVPLAMNSLGVEIGVSISLIFSGVWFVAMLRTSEMPH